MKAKAICIIGVLFFWGCFAQGITTAQPVVRGKFPLVKLEEANSIMKDEASCAYFFRSSITGKDRISFSYTDASGAKHNESPVVSTNVQLIIDNSEKEPAVTPTGKDDNNHDTWHIIITQNDIDSTYHDCLKGIPIHKK